ncbi:alpha/beta hydrolase [Streptomyces sp. ME19-01-6]|uniref:alpha/beta fold hydrolase n=1 Tax=Streptomyces sp. ME19-01-6 TaxID=3028686 RepID=UPI0029BA8E62|nr:alpha/beta hydrolase [Streptomyces sp. ME19-01-6]MDX3225006.1 alpha/beta hydrolase [Streptomyces sp. ME19-01-6]
MTRTDRLGEAKYVHLPQGTLRYHERGEGRPVVFVHGLFVNGDLWRHVVPPLADAGLRCITPDWPFGSHETPLAADADLSPPGIARLIADFLAALDLTDVVLVANDTGGAFSQIAVARHRERLGSLVLTPSDSLHRFFPPMFRYLQVLGRVPGSAYLIAQGLRIKPVHRLPLVLGLLSKRPLPDDIMRSYLTPMRRSRGVRRDLGKILKGVSNRHTLAAAEQFPKVDMPVLLPWAKEDRLFPIQLGEELARLFPHARLEPIEDSYTFVPEDQPERLAEVLTRFLTEQRRA